MRQFTILQLFSALEVEKRKHFKEHSWWHCPPCTGDWHCQLCCRRGTCNKTLDWGACCPRGTVEPTLMEAYFHAQDAEEKLRTPASVDLEQKKLSTSMQGCWAFGASRAKSVIGSGTVLSHVHL